MSFTQRMHRPVEEELQQEKAMQENCEVCNYSQKRIRGDSKVTDGTPQDERSTVYEGNTR